MRWIIVLVLSVVGVQCKDKSPSSSKAAAESPPSQAAALPVFDAEISAAEVSAAEISDAEISDAGTTVGDTASIMRSNKISIYDAKTDTYGKPVASPSSAP